MAKLDFSKLEIDWPILFGCFTGIILFSIMLELLMSFIETALHDHVYYLTMTRRIFKELTILGIITIVLIILASYADVPEEVFDTLEFAHLWLFVAEIAYLVQAIGTMRIVANVKQLWDKCFHHGFLAALHFYDNQKLKDRGVMKRIFMRGRRVLFGKRYNEETVLELWILRAYFIKTHELPNDFDFSKYLRRSLSKKVANEIEISWITWMSMLVVILVGVVITQFGPKKGESGVLDIELTVNVCFGSSIVLFVVVSLVMLMLFRDRDNLLAVAGSTSHKHLRQDACNANSHFASYSKSQRKIMLYEKRTSSAETLRSSGIRKAGAADLPNPGNWNEGKDEGAGNQPSSSTLSRSIHDSVITKGLDASYESATEFESDSDHRANGYSFYEGQPSTRISVQGVRYKVKKVMRDPDILKISQIVDTCAVEAEANRDVAKTVFLCASPVFLLHLYRLCLLLQCFIVALIVLILTTNSSALNKPWLVIAVVLIFVLHGIIFFVIIPKLVRNWHVLEAVCILDEEDLETVEEILGEQRTLHDHVHHCGVTIYNAIESRYQRAILRGEAFNTKTVIEVAKGIYNGKKNRSLIKASTMHSFLAEQPFSLLITRRQSRALLRILGAPRGINFCQFMRVVENCIIYVYQSDMMKLENDDVFPYLMNLVHEAIDDHIGNCPSHCGAMTLPEIIPLSWRIPEKPRLKVNNPKKRFVLAKS
mmetsp:Transcript_11901/g.15446  ORF Transcript_11901/g.15446 Transcript_11901/m.15446 type:complete len:709 (+) Transcript_11901:144-2270(+)